MNNKGFTLVELLAVIVILALLALLTTTSVTKLVKDAKDDLSDTQIKLIKKSAQMWGAKNINELPSEGNCSYLTLYDLKQYGLLDEDILDPKNNQNISNDIKIKISTDSNKMTTYEVNPSNINNCEAVYGPVCTAKTTSATANIAEGNYQPGDEYSCEVKEGTTYTFFVLSVEDDVVNLIMDSNIAIDGTAIKSDADTQGKKFDVDWIDTVYYDGSECSIDETFGDCAKNHAKTDKGPLKAFDYLHVATSNWTNIPNISIDYSDEGKTNSDGTPAGYYIRTEGKKTIITTNDGVVTGTFNNLKARLPKASEINALFIDDEENDIDYSLLNFNINSLPNWVKGYIGINKTPGDSFSCEESSSICYLNGYWLMSSVITDEEYSTYTAYDLSSHGFIGFSLTLASSKYYPNYANNNPTTGVRPVISIPKTRMN